MRTEQEFLDAIDCRFPFGDRALAMQLIHEGCALSPNAGFALVDEIVRPARGVVAPVDLRRELLRSVFALLQHPLVPVIAPLAERLVAGVEASVDEALAMMRKVAEHHGQYAALCIVYFSADDAAAVLDREDDVIRKAWAADACSPGTHGAARDSVDNP